MADLNEVDKRLYLLESEVTSVKEYMQRLDERTLEIKERIDKQNGWIPHLTEAVKELKTEQSDLMQAISKTAKAEIATEGKVKVMWAVLALAGASILTYLLKTILES